MKKRSESSAREGQAARKERRTSRTRKIDFSDIPEASATQLRAMQRVGRPPLGASPRQLIAIRLDPDILLWAKREAKRRSIGYQTLINEVLAKRARASA
jgi:uncharacterized protein (DUF4415 family)